MIKIEAQLKVLITAFAKSPSIELEDVRIF